MLCVTSEVASRDYQESTIQSGPQIMAFWKTSERYLPNDLQVIASGTPIQNGGRVQKIFALSSMCLVKRNQVSRLKCFLAISTVGLGGWSWMAQVAPAVVTLLTSNNLAVLNFEVFLCKDDLECSKHIHPKVGLVERTSLHTSGSSALKRLLDPLNCCDCVSHLGLEAWQLGLQYGYPCHDLLALPFAMFLQQARLLHPDGHTADAWPLSKYRIMYADKVHACVT